MKAAWIDFHDPIQNSFGYQRDFDEVRSNKARIYADKSDKPFWPESILAIRNDEDIDESEKVEWQFTPDSVINNRFGTLSVTYTEDLTIQIYGKKEPWRRAFSQVDCQHRLGAMGDSDKHVTFCIIPGITRREEALVFRAINQNQKAIPTSLVDTIIYRTDVNAPVHISWAWDLGNDLGSPFYRLVDTGGRGQDHTLITFRGLQQSLKLLIPIKHLDAGAIDKHQGYHFVRNFWQALKNEWPIEFENKKDYKMMVNPGVRALSRLGRQFFQLKLDAQDFDINPISAYLNKGKPCVNWSLTGPLEDATGKGAEKRVFAQLNEWFGIPS